MGTHGAVEGLSELEYVDAYSFKTPHQSHRITIGQGDVVQDIGAVETKNATFNNVKANRVAALIESTFPAASGWVVPAADILKVIEDSTGLDLWNFSLTGTRYVSS